MKVNFYVEDMLFFRYIGCSTVAKTLYNTLKGLPGLEVTWKSMGIPRTSCIIILSGRSQA